MSASNEFISYWDPLPVRTVHPQVLAPLNRVYKGTLATQIDGLVYNLDQDLTPLFRTVPGADANGGIVLWTTQANVFYSQSKAASSVLGLKIVYATNQININVTLAADGGAVVTSTANDVAELIWGHATASKYLHANFTGTGLGLAAAFVSAHVPEQVLLGLAEETYDNATNASALVAPMRFKQGVCAIGQYGLDPVTISNIGSDVAIADCNTIKATVGPLDYPVKLIDIGPTSGFNNAGDVLVNVAL